MCIFLHTGLENAGQNCWYRCHFKEGKCDWCGPEGYCCRQNWIGRECDGISGGKNSHQCVFLAGTNFLKTLAKEITGKKCILLYK